MTDIEKKIINLGITIDFTNLIALVCLSKTFDEDQRLGIIDGISIGIAKSIPESHSQARKLLEAQIEDLKNKSKELSDWLIAAGMKEESK